MKQFTSTILAVSLLAAAFSAQAQTEITANVKLINDYKFRGISQTDRGRALQGGFDYNHESGAYAGVWASSIDFADNIKMNYYAGYAGDITDTVGFDVGVLMYEYPGLGSADTVEVYAGLNYAGFTGKVSYTDDYFGSNSSATYWQLSHGIELIPNLNLGLHAGVTDARRKLFGNKSSYADYGVMLNSSAIGLDVTLGWIDTSLNRGNCGSNACGGRAIFSVGKSF